LWGVPAEIGNEHRYISLLGNRHSALNIQVWHLKSSEFDPRLANNVEKPKQVPLSKHLMRSNNLMLGVETTHRSLMINAKQNSCAIPNYSE
jgi:hypothetical protein